MFRFNPAKCSRKVNKLIQDILYSMEQVAVFMVTCCVQFQSDKRVKKVNELIQGIRVVKLLAWEDAFVQSVEHTRAEEIRYLIPHACLKGFMGKVWQREKLRVVGGHK